MQVFHRFSGSGKKQRYVYAVIVLLDTVQRLHIKLEHLKTLHLNAKLRPEDEAHLVSLPLTLYLALHLLY